MPDIASAVLKDRESEAGHQYAGRPRTDGLRRLLDLAWQRLRVGREDVAAESFGGVVAGAIRSGGDLRGARVWR